MDLVKINNYIKNKAKFPNIGNVILSVISAPCPNIAYNYISHHNAKKTKGTNNTII